MCHIEWRVPILCTRLGCFLSDMRSIVQIDLSREYWLRVFEPAISDWAGGVTPNPDISCNR